MVESARESEPERDASAFWQPQSDDALLAAALQANARATWRDLARLVGGSESTVARRVRALISSGAVRTTVLVDPIRCGLGLPVTVFFRVTNKSVRTLVDHLVARTDVRLVALLTGRHGVLGEFIVPSLADLERLLMDDLAAVDATFETTTEPVLREFKATVEWAHGLVAGVPGVRTPLVDGERRADPQPLDATDQALVDLLRLDGRTSFGDLGQAVGLSESAARRRFDALVESRRIHPVTLVAGSVLGLDAQYFVSLNVTPGQIDHAARVLADRPEVRYLAAMAGSSDLFFELMLPAHPDLHRFRAEVLGALPGVTGVAIAMNVQTLKRAFLPSVLGATAKAFDVVGGE